MFKSRNHRLFLESLENRRLLAITTAYDDSTGQLSILLDGPDDVKLEATESDAVLLNGKAIEQANGDISSLVVTATGDFANNIDLSMVDFDTFFPLSEVTIDAGAGNDVIGAPGTDVLITTGDGEDVIKPVRFRLQTTMTIMDDAMIQAERDQNLVFEEGSQLLFLGDRLHIETRGPSHQMLRGSRIGSADGDIFWEGRTDSRLQMEFESAITSATGDLTFELVMSMEDGSRITSTTGNLSVRKTLSHKISHLATNGDVRFSGGYSEVLDGGDTDVDIVANTLRYSSGSGGDTLEIDVQRLLVLGGMGSVTNKGDLYAEFDLDGGANVSTERTDMEDGDVVIGDSQTVTDIGGIFINAAGSISVQPGSEIRSIPGIELNADQDVLLDATSIFSSGINLAITGSPSNSHTFVINSQMGAFGSMTVVGGERDDDIRLEPQVWSASNVSIDGGGGNDTYSLSIHSLPQQLGANVVISDSGSAADVDELTIDLGLRPYVGSGTQIVHESDQQRLVVDFSNIERIRIISDNDPNLDGERTADDIDALFAAIATPSAEGHFDLNSDDAIDIADVTFFVEDVLSTRFGDVNLDTKVDFRDFLLLASNFGSTNASPSWSDGDLNGDDKVYFSDFLLLAEGFGFNGLE